MLEPTPTTRLLRRLAPARLRGAAMFEAVIAVGFFVLILSCVHFVRQRHSARHAALAHARACAWQYAFNNCESVPPSCGDILSEQRSGVVDRALGNTIESATASSGGGQALKVMSGGMGLIEDALGRLFGDRAVAEISGSVPRPAALGGGSAGLCQGGSCGAYKIACNIAPIGDQSLAGQAWDAIMR